MGRKILWMLMGIGLVGVLLIGLFVAMIVSVSLERSELNGVIQPIVLDLAEHNWDRSAFDRYTDDAFWERASPEGFAEAQAYFRSLGTLKSCGDIDGLVVSTRGSRAVFPCEFALGERWVTVNFVERDGRTYLQDLIVTERSAAPPTQEDEAAETEAEAI